MHRHLKLALSSATEKCNLTLLQSLIASLEDKKLELQGLRPAWLKRPLSIHSPQIGLVPPSVSTAQVSVTTVRTTSRPTGTTLHLVPGVDDAAVTAPPVAAAAPPASTPAPSVVESAPTPVVTPVQSIPPRTPIEPISSLFRTQETRPIPPAPEQTVPAPTPPPAVAAPTRRCTFTAFFACRRHFTVSDTRSIPFRCSGSSNPTTPQSPAAASAFTSTQEVTLPPSHISQTPSPTTPGHSQLLGRHRDGSPVHHEESLPTISCRSTPTTLARRYRSTVNVEDECDVQDLMHALLRQHFDDIGTDEWTPSYSTGAPRTTYLLDHDQAIVVETRTGLSRKDLADQVRADIERYRNRGRCAHLLCFIYDPEGRIGNPRGLESELCTTSEHFAVDVVVAPK